MTTANSTLRRELEEARQRAGDAEQRAAVAERAAKQFVDSRDARDTHRAAAIESRVRAEIQREIDALRDTNERLTNELEEARQWHDRALKARGIAHDLYTAFRDDPDADDAQRVALDRARRHLEYWGLL